VHLVIRTGNYGDSRGKSSAQAQQARAITNSHGDPPAVPLHREPRPTNSPGNRGGNVPANGGADEPRVLNGWQLSGTVCWLSALPFSVLSSPYSANGYGIAQGSGPQYASVVPGVPLYEHSPIPGVTQPGTIQWLIIVRISDFPIWDTREFLANLPLKLDSEG